MSANGLVEIAANLIETQIKQNIAQALADVRTNRNDGEVTTEVPRNYYFYGSAHTYRCPAVFIVPSEINFDKLNGANHINANIRIRVAIIVEDRLQSLLVVKAWRYQAAFHKVLNQQNIVSQDGKIKITCVVDNAYFSPEFTLQTANDPSRGMFQKEISLELNVRHRESF